MKKSLIKILLKMPFSYMRILRKGVGEDGKTVLDLGCGDGGLMEIICTGKNWKITGVDIFQKSLDKAKKRGIYKDFIKGDILKTVRKLIKQKKKFDVVFFSQVIEHIERIEGEKVLELLPKLSKKRIIVGTPRGFMHQPHEFIGDNPHQHHKSGWSLEDFIKRGYKVRGVGFMPIWKEEGLARATDKVSLFILTLIGYLTSPVVYYFPNLGAGIIATKNIKKKK